MKKCNGPCGLIKEDTEFYVKKYASGTIGLRPSCKPCSTLERDAWRKSSPKDNERNKQYNKDNAEIIKYKKLIKYWPGSTWQEAKQKFEDLLFAQNHKCAICKKHRLSSVKGLAVDHNHETGRVRGLLCNSCNRAVGLLQEDLLIMEEALIYIHKG